MTPEEFIKVCVARASQTNQMDKIKHRLQGNDALIPFIHGVLGLTTEVGELTDILKKYVFYGKDTDKLNILEEVGDILWYVAIILEHFGWTFEECMEMNDKKLEARYGKAFGETQANNRDLRKEKEAMKK